MKYKIGQKVYIKYDYAPNGLIEANIISYTPSYGYSFEMLNYSVNGAMTNSWASGTFINFRGRIGTCSEDLIVPYGEASKVLYGR